MRLNMRGNFHHWIVPTASAILSILVISVIGLLLLDENEVATDTVSSAKSVGIDNDQKSLAIQKKDSLNKNLIANQSALDEREDLLGVERLGTKAVNEIWPDAEVLVEETSVPDKEGNYRRVTLIQPRDLPYPVRIEKKIATDPKTGAEKLLSENEVVADRVIIKIKPGQNTEAIESIIEEVGGVLHTPFQGSGFTIVQLPELSIEAVPKALQVLSAKREFLEYAEPDYIIHAALAPNDPRYVDGTQWGLNNLGQNGGSDDADIDAPEGWEIIQDASNVIIAVIDTGTRYTHQDLAANMWVNTGEIPNDKIDNDQNGVIDDKFGFNSILNTGDPKDDNGHGTLVAGIIGAVGNNNIGVAGIAWRTQLMAVKFLSEDGNGVITDAVECINYSRLNGAQVINASWSGVGFSQTLLNAIEETREAGILFVAAAGNFSSDNDLAPLFPASFVLDNIVSVASSTRKDEVSQFSNFGESTVDIVAPGSAIFTTFNRTDSDYVTRSGTSMATPYVSGVIALLKARFSSENHETLINRLLVGGDKVSGTQDKVRSGARVNLSGSLNLDTVPALPDFITPLRTQAASGGGSVIFHVEVSGDPPLTYSWSKDGQPIPDASQNFLVVEDIDISKEGVYKVKVANDFGLNSSSASLFVATVRPELGPALEAPNFNWRSVGFALWFNQTDVTRDGVDAAASGLISDGLISQFETSVQGPGAGSFRWRSSSEVLFDYLRFAIDDEQQISISGINDWSKETFSIPEGEHVLSWAYTKDESLSVGNDRGYVDNFVFSSENIIAPQIVSETINKVANPGANIDFSVTTTGTDPLKYQWKKDGGVLAGETKPVLNLTAVNTADTGAYRVEVSNTGGTAMSDTFNLSVQDSNNALSLALDNNEWPWRNGSDTKWFNQDTIALDGFDALQSGSISNNESSTFETTVIGPGIITFYWKVSSEDGNDALAFVINDLAQESISGEVEWQQVAFAVAAGSNVLRWVYAKNESLSLRADSGWIDKFTFNSIDSAFPSIVRQPKNTLVFLGDSLSLSADATGAQPLTYQWRKNESALPGEINNSIEITANSKTVGGIYSVEVTNSNGSVISDRSSLVVFNESDPLGQALELSESTWQTAGSSNWFPQAVINRDGEDALQSGAIGNGQFSEFSINLEGSRTLSFWWKVSSELNHDYLRFYIDNTRLAEISGLLDWQQRHIIIPEGLHNLRWIYEKDFDRSLGQDTAWVDNISFNPASDSINPALDTEGLLWNTGGDASWYPQEITTFDREEALQSGNITHGEETWVETRVIGPGILSFWWRVHSEEEHDTLGFYFDDELVEEISDNTGWQRKSCSMGGEAHTLRWRYAKNATRSSGQDAAWLDQVFFLGSVAPFDNWKARHFTSAEINDPLISGNLADADDDGVANILDYALGQDPRFADRLGHPTVATVKINNAEFLTLTYRRNKLATDIDYRVEVSNDLKVWDSSTGSTVEFGVTNLDAETELVVVRDSLPISNFPKRFMRLRVEEKD